MEQTMSMHSFRSSRPDKWTLPKPYTDASLRRRAHGRILPMHEPSLLQRLFGLR